MGEPKFNSEPVWLNADGTKSPIVKATADAALPDAEPAAGPSQGFLRAMVAAEEDRLRAEGWRACIEHIRRTYHEWLSPEDMYFVARQNPYAAPTPVRPVRDAGDEEVTGCQCPPCPGRGNDGHGLTHCAECCFGSGVMADLDCPIHGDGQARPTTAAPVSGVAARAKGEGK